MEFRLELLYRVIPGDVSVEEEFSHHVISWGIIFLQNILIKGMIESGAK